MQIRSLLPPPQTKLIKKLEKVRLRVLQDYSFSFNLSFLDFPSLRCNFFFFFGSKNNYNFVNDIDEGRSRVEEEKKMSGTLKYTDTIMVDLILFTFGMRVPPSKVLSVMTDHVGKNFASFKNVRLVFAFRKFLPPN